MAYKSLINSDIINVSIIGYPSCGAESWSRILDLLFSRFSTTARISAEMNTRVKVKQENLRYPNINLLIWLEVLMFTRKLLK